MNVEAFLDNRKRLLTEFISQYALGTIGMELKNSPVPHPESI
jgi:hypothetical protein